MSEEEKYVGIKEDFFSKPLYPFEKVTLMGSHCCDCDEQFFGKYTACLCCGSENLVDKPLSRQGTLYSYTINRNPPPSGYKGELPYESFAVGMVQLPEGIAILAPLTGIAFDDIKIGMKLELVINEFYKDELGKTVLTYAFRPQDSSTEIDKGAE